MGTVGSLLADLRDVATRERTDGTTRRRPGAAARALILGRLMAFLVNDAGLWDAFRVTFDLTGAPRFPMVRLSVAVATVLVASPHLARPTRRLGEGLVVLLALSS